MIVTPLTDAGTVKATAARSLPEVSVPIVGALGTVAVAAQTRVVVFKRHKISKEDLRCVTGGRRVMLISSSSCVSTK